MSFTILKWFHRSGLFIFMIIAAAALLFAGCVPQIEPQPSPPSTEPDPPIQSLNNVPVINYMTAPEEVTPSSESEIHCVATDKDNDALTYSWSVSNGTIKGEGDVVTWTAPEDIGVYDIEVTVTDDNGGETKDSVVIKVATKPNQLPAVKLEVMLEGQEEFLEAGEEPIKVKREAVVQIKCEATDPDGDELRYTWAATQGRVVGEGNTVTYYALTSKGNQAVTATVIDSQGGQVKRSVYFDVPCCGSQ